MKTTKLLVYLVLFGEALNEIIIKCERPNPANC